MLAGGSPVALTFRMRQTESSLRVEDARGRTAYVRQDPCDLRSIIRLQ